MDLGHTAIGWRGDELCSRYVPAFPASCGLRHSLRHLEVSLHRLPLTMVGNVAEEMSSEKALAVGCCFPAFACPHAGAR